MVKIVTERQAPGTIETCGEGLYQFSVLVNEQKGTCHDRIRLAIGRRDAADDDKSSLQHAKRHGQAERWSSLEEDGGLRVRRRIVSGGRKFDDRRPGALEVIAVIEV
jgi:hypothetical protein